VVAAVGAGMWRDASRVDEIQKVEAVSEPVIRNRDIYDKLIPVFKRAAKYHSELGQRISQLQL
jgi:hypothetical protein